jgi:hypothetical protein
MDDLSTRRFANKPTAKPTVWRRLLIMRAMGLVPWSGMNVACGVVGVSPVTFLLTTAAGTASWSYVTASVGDILQQMALPGQIDAGSDVGSTGGGQSLSSLVRDPALIFKMVVLSLISLIPVLFKVSLPGHFRTDIDLTSNLDSSAVAVESRRQCTATCRGGGSRLSSAATSLPVNTGHDAFRTESIILRIRLHSQQHVSKDKPRPCYRMEALCGFCHRTQFGPLPSTSHRSRGCRNRIRPARCVARTILKWATERLSCYGTATPTPHNL